MCPVARLACARSVAIRRIIPGDQGHTNFEVVMNDIPDPADLFDEPREERPECKGCIDAAKRMLALLKNVGDSGTCRGCGLPIFWVTHKNGKKAPYDFDGLNHFGSCSKREDFKR